MDEIFELEPSLVSGFRPCRHVECAQLCNSHFSDSPPKLKIYLHEYQLCDDALFILWYSNSVESVMCILQANQNKLMFSSQYFRNMKLTTIRKLRYLPAEMITSSNDYVLVKCKMKEKQLVDNGAFAKDWLRVLWLWLYRGSLKARQWVME